MWTQCLTLAPSLTAEIVSLFEGLLSISISNRVLCCVDYHVVDSFVVRTGGWLAIMSKPLVYKPRKEKAGMQSTTTHPSQTHAHTHTHTRTHADPPQDPLLLVEEFSYLAEILDSYLLLGVLAVGGCIQFFVVVLISFACCRRWRWFGRKVRPNNRQGALMLPVANHFGGGGAGIESSCHFGSPFKAGGLLGSHHCAGFAPFACVGV